MFPKRLVRNFSTRVPPPRSVSAVKASVAGASASNTRLVAISILLAGALLTAPACAPSEAPAEAQKSDPVATAQEAVTIGQAWSAASGTISAVKQLYDGITWLNCNVYGYCPETDAQQAADRVILDVETVVESLDNSQLEGRFEGLLSRSTRDFGDVAALTVDEEVNLLNDTEGLYEEMSEKLLDTDPRNQSEVDAAYALAPSFNVLAAFLDHLARIELVRQHAPITYEVLNSYRARTLTVDEALAGSQALWYQCADGTQQLTSTAPEWVTSETSNVNSLSSKKLWLEFSNYQFSIDDCSNNCNVSRGISETSIVNPNAVTMCKRDCDIICFGVCGLTTDAGALDHEIAKITRKMNSDPVVHAVRAAMEALTGLAASHGSGLLWREPSGDLDLWTVLSPRSHRSVTLGNPDPAGWTNLGYSDRYLTTGDFNGDGNGDILWSSNNGTTMGLWELTNGQISGVQLKSIFAQPAWAHAGDLDGDGSSDLIWSDQSSSFYGFHSSVMLMNSGTLDAKSTSDLYANDNQIEGVGNFDNDGQHKSDILFQSMSTYNVSIAFNGSTDMTSIGSISSDWQIAGVGDFDGDHYSDILWYNINYGYVAVWTIQGATITSNVGTGYVSPSSGWYIEGVADVDHDGISDIVWKNNVDQTMSIWMMNSPSNVREYTAPVSTPPGGSFAGVVELGPPAPANPPAAPIGGAFCGATSGNLRNPGFAAYENWSGSTFAAAHGTLLGDVDGDMRADLVTLGDGYVDVLPSLARTPNVTGFGNVQTAWPGSFYGSHGTLIGDVDGDGRSDLVGLGDGYVGLIRSQSTPGYYQFANYQTAWGGSFYGSHGTFLADADGDGKADLIGVGNDYIGVIRSTGGGFGAYETWFRDSAGNPSASSGTHGTLVGDVSGDGWADVVELGDDAIWLSLSGKKAFENFSWVGPAFWGTQQTLLADVDGDGAADLVAIDANSVRVRRSLFVAANGSFGDEETWWGSSWSATHGVFLGDVDGNSRADLLGVGDGYVGVIRSQ